MSLSNDLSALPWRSRMLFVWLAAPGARTDILPFRHRITAFFSRATWASRMETLGASCRTAVFCFGFAALLVFLPFRPRAPSKKARLGASEQASLASIPAECLE